MDTASFGEQIAQAEAEREAIALVHDTDLEWSVAEAAKGTRAMRLENHQAQNPIGGRGSEHLRRGFGRTKRCGAGRPCYPSGEGRAGGGDDGPP